MQKNKRSRGSLLVVACVVALMSLLLTACGDSSSSDDKPSGEKTTNGSDMTPAEVEQVLAKSYEGIGAPVPETGPKAQTGKTVWLITCPALPGCLRVNAGFEAAAKSLGWNVKVVDGKADPTTTISLIKQAVAAKADGIVEVPLDCPLIKTGLQVAKKAGIPVLSWGGVDCNSAALGDKAESEGLFAAPVKTNSADDWAGWYGNEGKNSANFLIARVAQLGIENPTILRFHNTDATLNAAEAKSFKETLEAGCPSCKLEDVTFTFAQIVAGKGPQIFSSGLQAHPNANVLYYAWDAMLDVGLKAAVTPKLNQFKFVCCGDGGKNGLEQARKATDGSWAISAYGHERGSWAIADVMNRIFAGETEFPQEGGYSTFVDATHNMPAEGEFALGNYDYVDAYKKLWGTS